MLGNGLRRSTWQVIGLVLGAIYASSVFIGVLSGLAYLGRRDAELATTVLVLGGSLLVLAWWFLPLVAFGVDGSLDPHKLAPYAIPRKDLLLGLALAGVLGIPGIVTLLGVLGTAVVWARSPAAVGASVVCAVVALATCVVGSRASTTVLAPLRTSRRFREVAGVVVFLPVFVVVPTLGWASRELEADRLSFTEFGVIISWLPFGAVWAVPGDVAAGDLGMAALRFAVAVGVVVVLVFTWSRALDRQVGAPVRGGTGGSRLRGLGFLGAVRGSVVGAVAARCLTYWLRDPRYASSLAVVPLLPFLLVFLDAGNGTALLFLAPLAAFLLGWIVSADVAYDHGAFWLHVVTGVSGRDDRLGRVLAAGVVGLPVTIVFAVGSVWWTDRWEDLPAVLGAGVAVLLSTLGLSSVVSARFPYPVPRPGEGPFASPQGSAVASLAVQTCGWIALGALLLPTTVLAVAAVVTGTAALGWATLAVGVASGILWVVVGLRVGARIYDARSPELLQQVLASR
jgi:ABC-2 type transport system permease protein